MAKKNADLRDINLTEHLSLLHEADLQAARAQWKKTQKQLRRDQSKYIKKSKSLPPLEPGRRRERLVYYNDIKNYGFFRGKIYLDSEAFALPPARWGRDTLIEFEVTDAGRGPIATKAIIVEV